MMSVAKSEFGLIREKISQMTVDCFAAESVVWMVAHYIDSGSEDYSVEAAMIKVFASEALQRSAYLASQIVGRDKIFTPMPQPLRRLVGIYEDEEMNHLAGFILDKGSYPWDVVL
jgi:alkylation response protein AidB-like acyl-CoA dehydrogenase